jgi:hypothetical protein
MLRWAGENLLQLKPEEIGEQYGRYRLHVPEPNAPLRNRSSATGSYRRWWCAAAASAMS